MYRHPEYVLKYNVMLKYIFTSTDIQFVNHCKYCYKVRVKLLTAGITDTDVTVDFFEVSAWTGSMSKITLVL